MVNTVFVINHWKLLELGVVAYACNPSSVEAESEGSELEEWPLIHSKLKASLDYMKPYLRK